MTMPSAEDQALAAAQAAPRDADGALDKQVYRAEYERALAERHQRLKTEAQATLRALDGWSHIESRRTGWLRSARPTPTWAAGGS